MSGIEIATVTGYIKLSCDTPGCNGTWHSRVENAQPLYHGQLGYDDDHLMDGAWELGWRVYAGTRNQRTYCPKHHPKTKTPMLQLYPEPES